MFSLVESDGYNNRCIFEDTDKEAVNTHAQLVMRTNRGRAYYIDDSVTGESEKVKMAG